MAPHRNQEGLLARINFPLYTLQMLTSRHVLVGGGGGSAKTGVANGFEIYELFHNGTKFVAEEVTRHETGPSVVMNCATYNSGKKLWVVAGQESHCQLYSVTSKVSYVKNGDVTSNKDNVRQRRTSKQLDNQKVEKVEENRKKLNLVIKPTVSVQTDFCESEPLQRVVRINSKGTLMATGGLDGLVRLWKFPSLELMCELKGHSKEIDDIDFDSNDRLCTIAKDGKAKIWNTTTMKESHELTWQTPSNNKYLYKRCRFRKSANEDHLFMLSNAIVGKQPSFLQLWDTKQNVIVKSVAFKETLSALAVSDDAKFVAVGTMFSGSVDIFVAFNLGRALHVPGVHSMFVTGLEFLPTKLDGPAITSNVETAVVSISIDNKICVHSVPFRKTLPMWIVIVCIILSVCAAFILCSYLDI